MRVFKGILNFFLSLRTAIWLLIGLLLLLLFGSFIMPKSVEFQSINLLPLFTWLKASPFKVSWWLSGSVFLLFLLTANTILCSIESIIKKHEMKQWLLIISPQIIHIGFLFILLAHLFSSIGSMRANVVAYEGSHLILPNGIVLEMKNIIADLSPDGYIINYRADIGYLEEEGKMLKQDSLSPNEPSFYRGLGLYLKNIQLHPVRVVLLEVSREPGALLALIGGILFLIGTVILVAMKIVKEK
ncbi:MAG: cytochrome c biogenesis protein ResB [Nitrospirae bacterium]|nr:cytochrome c biogenesis protein ResB [Nitrospirota bacterium]